MSPRKLTRIIIALSVVIAAGLAWSQFTKRRVAPPPFPCIATAKSGWLTAVTSETMLRLEWGEGIGQSSVGLQQDPVNFKPSDEAAVRALALRVLEPISAPIRSSTFDKVSLFAGCDGVGASWQGESTRGNSTWRECLRPLAETRPDCLWRVWQTPDVEPDETPGAVADRILEAVVMGGVVLPVPAPPSWAHAPPPRADRSLIDRAVDFFAPPAPPEHIDFQF